MKLLISVFCALFIALSSSSVHAGNWWTIRLEQVQVEAEIVFTPEEQQMGLGNRFSLPDGQGMLFLYNDPGIRIFWMKRMVFPIDIIWLRKGKIVFIHENIPPPEPGLADEQLQRYGYGVLADMVLELPAGFVKRNRISIKSSLKIEKRN
jgi:uncharacterized protein